MKKNLNYSLILLVILALALFALGCNKTSDNNDDPNQNPSVENPKIDTEIVLYFSDDQAMYLVPEQRLIQMEADFTNQMLITTIVENLISGPENQTLIPTLPPESRLLGVEVEHDLATINFSEEIQTTHWGGSTGELMTINSLVNSITEIENIKKVQILVEGQVQESLIGHLYTKDPLERDEKVIKK